MCTVTVFPLNRNNFVLTSNRDEAPNRETIPPKIYDVDNLKMLFPKDKLAGGTWIGVSHNNLLICLLNGGFFIHKRKTQYRKSRGIVVKDLLATKDITQAIKNYDFDDIEPFTLVIIDWNLGLRFFEMVWDGTTYHLKNLPLQPHIWSSSTLYNKTMKAERKLWFKKFILNSELNAESVLNFHKHTGKEHKDFGIVMNRFFVKTTSITQVEKINDNVNMTFNNLQTQTMTKKSLLLTSSVNE